MIEFKEAVLGDMEIRWLELHEPKKTKWGTLEFSVFTQFDLEEDGRAEQWRQELGLNVYETEYNTWGARLKKKIRGEWDGKPLPVYGLSGKLIDSTYVGNGSRANITVKYGPYSFEKDGETFSGTTCRLESLQMTEVQPSQKCRTNRSRRTQSVYSSFEPDEDFTL